MLFTIHLNLKVQHDLSDQHWIWQCLKKVSPHKMKLKYLQTEIFSRILALELFSHVTQLRLPPLVGASPEEWVSYIFLLELASPSRSFKGAISRQSWYKRSDPPDLKYEYVISPANICISDLSYANEFTCFQCDWPCRQSTCWVALNPRD